MQVTDTSTFLSICPVVFFFGVNSPKKQKKVFKTPSECCITSRALARAHTLTGGGVKSGSGAARTMLDHPTFFISLVLGPLNSLIWYVTSLRYTRGLGRRILKVHTRPRLAYALRCKGY